VLQVIREAQSRLCLGRVGQAIVNITAYSKVDQPPVGLDLILEIERDFLNIGASQVVVIAPPAGQIIRHQNRVECAIGQQAGSGALRRAGKSVDRGSVSIHAR
jgi:hypothetical protein